MRRKVTWAVTAALAGSVVLAFGQGSVAVGGTAERGSSAAAPRSAVATCAVTWGSMPETAPFEGHRPLVDVRTGRHECFDRMVLDIRGDRPAASVGYRVRYVGTLHQDGSGRPLAVRGGAVLEIVVGAPSHDPETYEPTYAAGPGRSLPDVNLAGYRTFRDARFGASYEGTTQLGLGVRARLPFRVFPLGDRVVIDVAHSWSAER